MINDEQGTTWEIYPKQQFKNFKPFDGEVDGQARSKE